jgi:hypothetical protein
MAGSERSKTLPLAAGSCYEGKGRGGIEPEEGISQAALERKTDDHRCPHCKIYPGICSPPQRRSEVKRVRPGSRFLLRRKGLWRH